LIYTGDDADEAEYQLSLLKSIEGMHFTRFHGSSFLIPSCDPRVRRAGFSELLDALIENEYYIGIVATECGVDGVAQVTE